jgi:hypothetical protein
MGDGEECDFLGKTYSRRKEEGRGLVSGRSDTLEGRRGCHKKKPELTRPCIHTNTLALQTQVDDRHSNKTAGDVTSSQVSVSECVIIVHHLLGSCRSLIPSVRSN